MKIQREANSVYIKTENPMAARSAPLSQYRIEILKCTVEQMRKLNTQIHEPRCEA